VAASSDSSEDFDVVAAFEKKRSASTRQALDFEKEAGRDSKRLRCGGGVGPLSEELCGVVGGVCSFGKSFLDGVWVAASGLVRSVVRRVFVAHTHTHTNTHR